MNFDLTTKSRSHSDFGSRTSLLTSGLKIKIQVHLKYLDINLTTFFHLRCCLLILSHKSRQRDTLGLQKICTPFFEILFLELYFEKTLASTQT